MEASMNIKRFKRAIRFVFVFFCLLALISDEVLTVKAQTIIEDPPGTNWTSLNIPVSLAICPPSLAFGETIQCSIATPGESDSYTFTADAGDTLLVRMSRASGNVWPGIRVFLGTTLLCEATGLTTTEIPDCSLPGAGTYTIRAYDAFNNTFTGDYYLYLQRLNHPANAIPITLGQTISGTIGTPAEEDSYTFTVASNDSVLVRMVRSSGNVWPGIKIFSGITQLCQASDLAIAVITNCILPGAGTYTIQAYDAFDGTFTGDYSLYLQSLTDPGNSVLLTLGVAQEVNVTSGDSAWFRIDVPGNTESLFFTLQKYGSWNGELKLYGGSQLLVSTSGYADQIIQWPSPVQGTYLLEVSGSGSGRLTAYTKLPELTMGKWFEGSIYSSWGSAWYQFTVPPGQSSIHLHVETFGPHGQLKLYRGALDGMVVGSALGSSMDLDISSPEAGIYYAQVSDSTWIQGSNQTRDHMIRLDTNPIDPPPCTTPIISSFTPDKGGTAGLVTVSITGQCLAPNSSVQLTRTGYSDMTATLIAAASDHRSLTGTFNLVGVAPGTWNLVVTGPNAQSVTAQTPFTVESGGEAKLWVDVLGRSQIRAGRTTSFLVNFGNSGDVDLYDAVLILKLPAGVDYHISGPGIVEDPNISSGAVENGQIVVPIWLLRVNAGSESSFTLDLTTTTSIPAEPQFEIKAGIFLAPRSLFSETGNPDNIDYSPTYQSILHAVVSSANQVELQSTNLIEGSVNPVGLQPSDLEEALNQAFKKAGAAVLAGTAMALVVGFIVAACIEAPLYCPGIIPMGIAAEAAIKTLYDVYKLNNPVVEFQMSVWNLFPIDPEDKYGPSGYDAPDTTPNQLKHWIPPSQPLNYGVDFWNQENATAATVDVIITDSLNSNLDWSTFKFTEVGFLDWKVPLEPTQYFNVDIPNVSIDFSKYFPGQPTVIMTVNVEGTFDPGSGTIKWEFHALDPVTRQPPDNPLAGFLPPITTTGWEVGWVNFKVSPKSDLASGTVISNQAFVKFDANTFMPAPAQGPFINTLDAVPPISAVQSPVGLQQCDSFTVSWSGADDTDGSGLRGYDVYVDDLGDANPAYPWQANTSANSTMFTGVPGKTYRFYTRARDNVGNLEFAPQPSGYDIEVTAGDHIIGCNGLPAIEFTYLPPYGTPIWPPVLKVDVLTGLAHNVTPADYHVVCYIYVPQSLPYTNGWWIKPHDYAYNGNNLWETPIEENGGWGCDITTGGYDPYATIVEAYLVPEAIKLSTPPSRDWLVQNAAAKVATTRAEAVTVLSVTRMDPNPTISSTVKYSVRFPEPVTGIESTPPFSDFALFTEGVSGAAITNVSGTDDVYTVTINTGIGSGAIRLDVVDDDSIVNVIGIPLGGSGAGNGNYVSGETYTITQGANITIGTQSLGAYPVLANSSTIISQSNIVNGPVQVTSARGGNLFTSERVISGTSFNEVMGFPNKQLTTEYWFPWYENKSMATWILVGNPSTTAAKVDIYVAGVKRTSAATIPAGGRITPRYAGIQGGPVRVVSTNGVKIFASERALYGSKNAFNEMMGYPSNQFASEYWFPWYDNKSMATSIVVGNSSTKSSAKVDIYIGGVKKGSYTIAKGGTITQRYTGIQAGPVRVVSTNNVPIVTSERTIAGTSFNEVLGSPANQFTTEYWFPWYDNVSMATWVLVGNPSTTSSATVDIYIGGVKRGSYVIPKGGRITPRFPLNMGPVRVISRNGVKIFASERVLYGPDSAFNEVMGYPGNKLDKLYWFPWYDSTSMSTDIVVGMP
jgi:hypothetical protein